MRCAGTQPCPRCVHHSLQCLYNKVHRRGKPLPPEPGIPVDEFEQGVVRLPSVVERQPRDTLLGATHEDDLLEPSDSSHDQSRPDNSSQNAESTRLEGDYIGPTSGISFLHRAQKRFQQDYATITSRNSESHASKEVPVLSFGDGWMQDYSESEFLLPSRADANGLLGRYFEFAMPTYRFVHRPTIEASLERMYDASNAQPKGVSNAKKAIVILIMATAKLYSEDATDLLPDGQSRQSQERWVFTIPCLFCRHSNRNKISVVASFLQKPKGC